MTSGDLQPLHATAVAINGHGVLLLGRSGCGKSDLALRLIDRGAHLISDDGTLIDPAPSPPHLRTAPNIAGMIEVRGVGIIKLPFKDAVPLHLVVTLGAEPERLPEDDATIEIAGQAIRHVILTPFESSATIKVEYALRMATGDGTE